MPIRDSSGFCRIKIVCMMTWNSALITSVGLLAGVTPSVSAVADAAAVEDSAGGAPRSPNILFISVDDLRPELPCFGAAEVIAPAIDRLASGGVVFQHHYVNNPICIPSRAILLTGTRSERTHQLFGPTVWTKIPGIEPIGRTFQQAGYTTVSLGKIWHTPDGKVHDDFDFRWDPEWAGPYHGNNLYASPELKDKTWPQLKKINPPAAEHEAVEDEDYPDGRTTTMAVKWLRDLAAQKKPFLLMAGFKKPHLPFCCPKKYYDLYENVEISMPPNPDYPKDMPAWAHNNFNDLQYYSPCPQLDKPLDATQTRELRRSYFACISYIDAQIGMILDALKETGLDQNTIVVLWGDHGFHLGDQGLWSKTTNYERAAHSPLLFVLPPSMQPVAGSSDALVETVDIYPTLLELCGIPNPPVMDGQSFVPLLRDLSKPWKTEVFHVSDRWRNFVTGEKPGGVVIGYAVRTDRYRYVEWVKGWNIKKEDRKILARELYDYDSDPEETRNLAGNPEYKAVMDDLQRRLVAGAQHVDVE